MKFTLAVAAIVASVAAQTLSECGQLCVNNMIQIANTQFGCANGDAACYCRNEAFGLGLRDCSLQACGADIQSAVVAYGNTYCSSAASAATAASSAGVTASSAASSASSVAASAASSASSVAGSAASAASSAAGSAASAASSVGASAASAASSKAASAGSAAASGASSVAGAATSTGGAGAMVTAAPMAGALAIAAMFL